MKIGKPAIREKSEVIKTLKEQIRYLEITSDLTHKNITQGTSCYERNKIRISCSIIGEGSRTF